MALGATASPRSPRNPLYGNLAVSVALAGVAALTQVALARGLGPTGVGLVVSITVWLPPLLILSQFGQVEHCVVSSVTHGPNTVRACGPLPTVLSSALFGVPAALLIFGDDALVIVGTVALFFSIAAPTSVCLSTFQAQQHWKVWNTLRAIVPIVVFLVSVLLVSCEVREPLMYVAVFPVAAVCQLLAVWRASPRCSLSRPAFRDLVTGFPYLASNIFRDVGARLDLLMITLLGTTAQVGMYVPVFSIGTIGTLGGVASAQVALVSRGSHASRQVLRTTIGLCLLVLVTSLGGVAMIPLVFGEQYITAQLPALVLSLGLGFLSRSSANIALLKSHGFPVIALIPDFVKLVTTFLVFVLLFPQLGLVGAAGASSVGYCLAWLISEHLRRKFVG